MARMRTIWHGPKLVSLTRQAEADRLDHCGRFLRDDIRLSISTVGYAKVGRKRVINTAHSAPGQPPFEQLGTLIASYGYQTDRRALVTRVGSGRAVARYLEKGTRRMKPRPHLLVALVKNRGPIMQILGAPIR
jgi:hypothetical protein